MMQQEERLKEYARLVIEIGINIQPGEPVLIAAPVAAAEFVRLLAQYSYERGASDIIMDWRDDVLSRLRFEHAPMDTLEDVPSFSVERLKYYYDKGANRIAVLSDDPELLNGIPMERIQRASMAHNRAFQPLQHYTLNDENSWCVVAVPNPVWAQKVYPDLSDPEEAYERLWAQILDVCRMNEPDPIQAWKEHLNRLEKHASILNDYQFSSVHYTSSNGTDLEVRLPEGHLWMAATSKNKKGTEFLPNIPTEEVFSVPHREGVNGTLVATLPLAYNGTLIRDFVLHFEQGAVTSYEAKQGGETLKALFAEDPNAVRLGEIALVPYDSPISNAKTLFFETLFDENASCHFAFGACYPTTLKDGTTLSEEELMKRGGNVSSVHVDFMVGAPDLSIIGTTHEGKQVTIFHQGNFAF